MSADQLPSQLQAAESIPIAQLSPELQEPKTRVVRGVVTITWPYSIIKKTIAFLLAEPDFRLRRAKGQVRVEFRGSSAKAVQDAGLGSGDEVVLCLDGVELVADDSKTRVPGTSLEWQLIFTERLLLQAKISDSDEVKLVDIDHPAIPEPEPAPEQLPESILESFKSPAKSPEPAATPVRNPPAKRPAEQDVGFDEYASPAFLKRARVSYGSLFEGSLDIFNEDISAKARAKKKAKTGRYSGVWKYASRSPSPEPDTREDDEADDTSMVDEPPAVATPARPTMVDEGCQTVEQETSPPRDVQVAAEARHDPAQYLQTPSKSTMVDSGVQSDLPGVLHTPGMVMTPGMNGAFVQPIFTAAHDQYSPAFDHPPPGPVFSHGLDATGMEPEYHADDSFRGQTEAYPEAGLEHGIDSHPQYPASFLETPHFDPHLVAPQPTADSASVLQDHHSPHDAHVADTGHHTTFVDGIVEPSQVPWGFTSIQHSRSPPKSKEAISARFEPGAPEKEQATAEKALGTEPESHERDEDVDGQQAALRVEEDQLSDDRNGPEEAFTSRTYAERQFEPTEEEEGQDAAIEVSGEEQDSSSGSSSSSEESDAEAEHEEDDVGGDYDISNYRNLSNNQDDDDASDLGSDYGQEEEEEVFDPSVQGIEDDEIDEDAEDYAGDYDEEEDYDDEDQENQPPPAAPQAAPQVISLLSDSEDEEDDPAPPPPAPAAGFRGRPQHHVSADDMDEDEEEEEGDEDEEDGAESDDHEAGSEEDVEGVEEDGPEAVTPTPKPRDAKAETGDMTTTIIDSSFETMSPIQLPHTAQLSRESPRPGSRDDSEMLEAELEHELEEEIAANDSQKNRTTSPRPETKPAEVLEVQMEEKQEAVIDAQATDADEHDAEAEDVRMEEVRNAPQETTVTEVDMEPTEGAIAEPMDINMADADEKPADEAAPDERPEESEMDVEDAAEPRLTEELDEEHLIQSQLEDGTMDEPQESTSVVETERQDISAEEGKSAEPVDALLAASLQEPVVEKSLTAVGASVTEPATTTDKDEITVTRESEDAMEVDEPDAIGKETGSPPATRAQYQSFEEVKISETQISAVVEEAEVEDGNTQPDQLPTPGETQVTESIISQTFTETQTETQTQLQTDMQITEEETTTEVPPVKLTESNKPEKDGGARSLEKPENPGCAASPINEEPSQIRGSSAQPSEARSSLIAEEQLAEEGNAAQPSPRRGRGHRRNRSDNRDRDQDPSVSLARASIASRRSTRLSDRTTPDSAARVVTSSRGRSHSFVLRSDSPDDDDDNDEDVLLARAAIKSPSRRARDVKEAKETREGAAAEAAVTTAAAAAATADQMPTALKTQLAKSLREVPDCIPLKLLRNHPGRTVDVIAIATTEPPEAKRAKGGPRGIMLAFNVTDHSVAPAQTVAVQIFRPHKAALPVVHPGDAVLLRQFSIVSMPGRGFGLGANDGSSWAVFERDGGEDGLPQIRGPPVEISRGESGHAALLKQWYAGLDDKAMAKLGKANEAAAAADAAKE
ncbi:hypothetical protein CMUS01_05275 [Colletotrichum musicola]|uniref:Telomeric single stranded DNA binding POT1/Cdc13 domain-containing protein n=1 Tax=Colletotrichum musicola TaxID=2175873 RepID=A0A8H6NLA3_9PEZI|nr:hypothetical protein CMUS01_05275 [Colletotrichum musicola]